MFIQFYRLMGTVLNSFINSEYDEVYTRLFCWHRYSREEYVIGRLLLLLIMGSIMCETDNWLNLQILLD